ncbi:Zinc- or iron-chelating domain-containing protein [Candidatus Magnetomoraceae bacterium gMMP-15]
MTMNIETKLSFLDQLYKIYDDFTASLNLACKKYCAQCCTCNVTMTGLEGYKLTEYLISTGRLDFFKKIEAESSKKRFQPKITTNMLAQMCMEDKEIPDEESNPLWGRCLFLSDNKCPVYKARPFGCRCFVSMKNCQNQGYAYIDPFVITVNNVFLQYIEHIDLNGFYGNMTDILLFMESNNRREAYKKSSFEQSDIKRLISNKPIKALMIPPEHRNKIEPILHKIQNIN